MAGTDEFHQGLRFKRVGKGLGAVEIYDTTTLGMNLSAPDADNSIPRNEPFLLFKSDLEKRAALGVSGTAKKYLDTVFNAVDGAQVIVNLYEEGATPDLTLANAVGDAASQTGLFALEAAEAVLGAKGKILLTPGLTHFRVDNAANPVLIQQGLLAKQLGAVHISSSPGTTDEDAVTHRGDLDDERLILVDPFVKTLGGIMTAEAHMAAVGILTDKKTGFHASWGNKILPGVLGVSRPVPHHITESDTRANYLLKHQINTIINQDGGWRSWGDWAATTNTDLQFYCQTRVDDIINEALARTIWRVISEPLIPDQISAVVERMNAFLDAMVRDKKLSGGKAEFKGDRNSANALERGKITLSYDAFSPPPIILVDIEHTREPRYLEKSIKDILATTNYANAA